MALFHMAVKVLSRSRGQSSVAAAAYRSGTQLRCARTGTVIDYTRRRGVVATQTLVPGGIAREREALWNAIEAAETRSNSSVAREFELALPVELTVAQRERLAMDFGRALVDRYGIAVDLAIHAPSRVGDQRNHHVHLLTSTRVMDERGGFGAKVRVLDAQATGPSEVTTLRERWAELCNEALAAAGSAVRVDHRSHAERSIAALPGTKLGVASVGYERRTGKLSERRIRQQAQRAELEETIARAITREEEAEHELQPIRVESTAAIGNALVPIWLLAPNPSFTDELRADRGGAGGWRGCWAISSPMIASPVVGARARPDGKRVAAGPTGGAGAGEAAFPLQMTDAPRGIAAGVPAADQYERKRPAVDGAAAGAAMGGIHPAAIIPLAAVPLALGAGMGRVVAPASAQGVTTAPENAERINPQPAVEHIAIPPSVSASAQHDAIDEQLMRSVLGSLRAHYAAEARAMVLAMGARAYPEPQRDDVSRRGDEAAPDVSMAAPAPAVPREPPGVAHDTAAVRPSDAEGRRRRGRRERWAAHAIGVAVTIPDDHGHDRERRRPTEPTLPAADQPRGVPAADPAPAVGGAPPREPGVMTVGDARSAPVLHGGVGDEELIGRFDLRRRRAPTVSNLPGAPPHTGSVTPQMSTSVTGHPSQVSAAPAQPRTPAPSPSTSTATSAVPIRVGESVPVGRSGQNARAGGDDDASRVAAKSSSSPTAGTPTPAWSFRELYVACVELAALLLRLTGGHRHEAALLAILDADRTMRMVGTPARAAPVAADAATRFREDVARHAGALASVPVDQIARRVEASVARTGHLGLQRIVDLSHKRNGAPGPGGGTRGRAAPSPNNMPPRKPGGRDRD